MDVSRRPPVHRFVAPFGLGPLVPVVALLLTTVLAQQSRPVFEVASVRPAANDGGARFSISPGGVFSADNTTIRDLVRWVYRKAPGLYFRSDEILGGANWTRTDRFTIHAKATRPLVPEQDVLVMVQALLEDRFKLVVTREQEVREAYRLRLARADGRLGPDLHRQSETDCGNDREKARVEGVPFLPPIPQPSRGGRPWTGGSCKTMADLAVILSRMLQTNVTDETGLTGTWGFALSAPDLGGAADDPNTNARLFSALPDQLGLKLDRQRAPVDVVVIKSVERPSAN